MKGKRDDEEENRVRAWHLAVDPYTEKDIVHPLSSSPSCVGKFQVVPGIWQGVFIKRAKEMRLSKVRRSFLDMGLKGKNPFHIVHGETKRSK